jgi:hypothetical protein
MLTMVAAGVNMMAREVIMHHPNTMNVEVYRREVTRTNPSTGGMGTLGGMGMMSSTDEDEITWAFVGHGYGLPAAENDATTMRELGDVPDERADDVRWLLEPEDPIGEPGGFEIRKDDVFFVVWGVGDDAPRTAYEITAVETMVRVPPFVPRYVCVPRDDLDRFGTGDDED